MFMRWEIDLNLSGNPTHQKNLTTVFGSKKTVSVEISWNDGIDLHTLPTELLDFVSVTWRGNFEGEDIETIPPILLARQLILLKINVLLHVPCRNLTLASAQKLLRYIRKLGIRNILALEGESQFVTKKNTADMDFPHTSDFVEFVKETFTNDFIIGVTGYPQKHPRSSDMKEELEFLKLKVSRGADFILTQGCLDKGVLSDFHKKCREFGISIPIVVGTFSLRSPEQLDILRKCNIQVENDLFQFREEMLQHPVTFESFFGKRLREIVEMVRDDKIREFAGLHFFLFKHSDKISEMIDEVVFFAKQFVALNS